MVLTTCRSVKISCCVVAICIASSGCQMFEALSPAQLWKLNRQPNMDSGDAYFSVPAEVDEQDAEEDVMEKLEAPDS